MLGSYRRLVFLPPLLLASAACNSARTATDLNMDRMEASRQAYGTHFTHMVDNAILRDMSVADAHFVPHTAEINGIGEVRLNRMAAFLNTYGGKVRYETLEGDEALVEARLSNVREYLELTGCDMGRVQVLAMMAGGRGLPGDEAVKKFTRGIAKEGEQSGSLLPGVGMLPQSQGK
jgi:hypothetical protein